ncbi:MAG: hypothetical protein V4640_07835 [Verrucomicrobiota bacterium]
MKSSFHPIVRVAGLLAATTSLALAQETSTSGNAEIEALRQQVQDLTRVVHDLQAQVRESNPATPARKPAAAARKESPPSASHSAKAELTRPVSHEADLAADLPSHDEHGTFNPQLTLILDSIASYSSSANNANFIMRDIELVLQADAGELAHAYAVFNAGTELDPWTKTDPFEDISLGVEEAAIETTSLPYGLGIKAGQFFANFARLGKMHSNELPFTDRPVALEAILGGETKARGVEFSWTPPTHKRTHFTVGAVDQIGAETAVTGVFETLDGEEGDLFSSRSDRSMSDLTWYTRAQTGFDLSNCVSLSLGADYARGTDAGTRQLASGDVVLTWTPDAAAEQQLEVGGEFLHGSTDGSFASDALFAGGPRSGSSTTDGAYLYAQYRINKVWEPGIRYDWFRPEAWSETDANADGIADGLSRSTSTLNAVSAYLTCHLDETNRLRFEVSRFQGDSGSFSGHDGDWVGYLQWTVVLGDSHAHCDH